MKLDNKKLILSGLFITIGMILPIITGQIREIGNMLLPMHIPVILCGLICGPIYGFIIGLILPIFRSLIFGMPILFPNSICMSLELMTYGFLTSYLYDRFNYKCIKSLYKSLIISMIVGRIVWGIASFIFYGVSGQSFTLSLYITGAILKAIPGIIIQLIIIPIIMVAIKKTKLVKLI